MSSTTFSPSDAPPTDSADTNTGQFKYGVAMFISVLAVILLITLATFICTRLHLSYLSRATTVLRSVRRPTNMANPSFFTIAEAGLDEATLNSFPTVPYSQAKVQGFYKEGSSCSICLGEYKESDVLRVLPDCGHSFHQNCVDPWLRLRPTCPICRNSPLPSPMPTPLAEVAPLTAARGVKPLTRL
ncbi:hypothetical protein Cgig2_030425 [Carnegiea gigantea]|uniref:RING-type E3 ubiquitin transferase n=1 Tax=Carnegiea gigantea TaxID=171969 RepID=A0A9Q1QMF5_9CARY|nr:hypothetical protein Cgig2_030425 [Carnegiea gigantea]